MILDRSTEKIKEIKWSDINAVLSDIADYFLMKFENTGNIRESLLHQFESAVNEALMGINLQDYIRTGNCSLELIAKYNKLLNIKDEFCSCNTKNIEDKNVSLKETYDKEEVVTEKQKENLDNTAEIEGYIKKIEERQKDGGLKHKVEENPSIGELAEDYSAIAELLEDEDITIKTK